MNGLIRAFHAFFSWLGGLFGKPEQLHKARFARKHELSSLEHDGVDGTSLLLGAANGRGVYRVRSTEARPELGNLLVVAPTRGGKGLLAISQLLTWPHSVVVLDIKGELLMIWGRQDPHVPFEGRNQIREALESSGTNYQWLEFNGAHAFLRDEGPRYNPSLAQHCYALVIELFKRKLGEGDRPAGPMNRLRS